MNTVDDFKAQISKSKGLARSNLFWVKLPEIKVPGEIFNADDLNVICKSTQLPGRQIMTMQRDIGLEKSHVAYGYNVEDVTLTFHVMNDYKIKKYFETWQSLAVNNNNNVVNYFTNYAKEVSIRQLKRGLSLPIYKNNIDFLDDIPSNIKNRLPKIGPIDLSQGEIDLSFITGDLVSYECTLRNAFPTSVVSIDLGDNMTDGLVELSVSLSYTNWYNRELGGLQGFAGLLANFGIF